ncbi:Nodulin-like - like 4 [Theobroma cacao]|nr:Nodulin-like - like 4 [Theobroma cacao]
MRFRETYTFSAWKWLGFVSAVWVQTISGNNYTFSNYSDAIKTLMNLTQLELNNLSVAKDVGKAFGLLAGLASDRLPTPVILLIGSIEGLIGYGAQWLVVSHKIQPLPYWQMCIFLCMGGNSTTWMNTAVLVTCIHNFRRNRGPVSGILKGYVGLSTAIFTDLCSALFSNDPAKFLIMLAVIPFAVCLTAIFFLRETPQTASVAAEKEETRYFAIFNIVAVVVAVYLLAYAFIVSVYSFVKSWRLVGFEADKERQEPLLKEEATEARKAEIVAEEEEEVAAAAVAAEVEVAVVEKSRILN